MTLDQQALEWAKANPKDPRSQHIQAKVWANQNPNDPRSAQILDQISKSQSAPPSSNPTNPYNVADTFKQHIDDFKKQIEVTPDTVNQIGANALLPAAGAALAKGAGMLGRIGIGAAMGATQGGIKSEGDMASNVAGGAALGGLGASALEGVGKVAGALGGAAKGVIGNVSKAYQLSKGDPALQDEASGMINSASKALTKTYVADKSQAKSIVDIDPSKLMGKSPEIDALVKKATLNVSPDGSMPTTAKMSVGDVTKITNAINAPSATDSARFLEQSKANPVTSLTSNNFDRIAKLRRASDESGVDLAAYAQQLRAASKTAKNPIKNGISQTLGQGLSGAVQGASDSPALNDPRALSAILGLIK